ncbi:MAG: hypothetical protein Q9M97_05500, partial [Candidatus Gracilibacteria bacterium]|nr:hypothetical protein [Candidatus Gracilibacteria bacterium]
IEKYWYLRNRTKLFINIKGIKTMIKQINFSVINLGCTKNLVDLEYVLGDILSLKSKEKEVNFFPNPDDDEVEYLIINTCGFLSSSGAEAEGIMEDYNNIGKKLIIIGCYVPVKDDDFLATLENLEAVIPYEEIKILLKYYYDEKN